MLKPTKPPTAEPAMTAFCLETLLPPWCEEVEVGGMSVVTKTTVVPAVGVTVIMPAGPAEFEVIVVVPGTFGAISLSSRPGLIVQGRSLQSTFGCRSSQERVWG